LERKRLGYDMKGNNVYTLNNGNGKIMRYSSTNKLYLETEIINGEIQFKRLSLLGKVGEIDFVNKKKKSYYSNENLEFECGYINNTKHGKAKEYYLTGELEFEGEYLYGLKWNGKKYDKNGNVIKVK